MAHKEKDSVSGQYTTGHEWDGIQELNTPLPKWWVYVFWATVIWAIAYWIAMPAWPTINGYTQGVLGYSSRANLDAELAAQKAARAPMVAKLQAASVEEIAGDKTLMNFALAGGKIAFGENCAPCHASNGNGVPGAYPRLADDEWIWGGTLADIEQTIKFGVRSSHADTRAGVMPAFGTDGLLEAQQIDDVSDYVLSLSQKAPAKGSAGETVYVDNCAVCHGESGEGMAALGAPALSNNIWLFKGGKDGIKAQVTAPKHGVMPAWVGRLDEGTIKMLAIYVHGLGGGQK